MLQNVSMRHDVMKVLCN